MERPIVQAFLICDQVIQDMRTKKKSLIGIFSSFKAKGERLTSSFQVFASLTNGNGTANMELRILEVETDRVLAAGQLPLHFSDPNRAFDMVMAMNVTFPQPGVYAFCLFWEDELIAERRIAVTQTESDPTADDEGF